MKNHVKFGGDILCGRNIPLDSDIVIDVKQFAKKYNNRIYDPKCCGNCWASVDKLVQDGIIAPYWIKDERYGDRYDRQGRLC